MTTKPGLHPCQSCGACCASFRVSFQKKELSFIPETSPLKTQIVDQGGDWYALKGTEIKHKPACYSLRGRVGELVHCEIYQHRPSPCRQFQASYEDGVHYPRCDEARAKHGLRPLHPKDWRQYEADQSEIFLKKSAIP